tara:strand:+ start:71 stop:244 length:174 start_codon:yes stop_codon:yes gene_type:complete
MSDIEKILSGSLPTPSKDYIKYTQPISDTTNSDDVYILRTLIDKINELVEEVNKLKN